MTEKSMFLIFYILLLFTPLPVSADTGHIIISEIQTDGQLASDEFVELYNPTGTAVDVSGWRLTKKSSTGTESNLVSHFADGTTIKPYSFFLITPQSGYTGTVIADATYSGASASFSVAGSNTVILKDGSGVVIDKVGFGFAKDFENEPAINPSVKKSINRPTLLDTDNNKNDFVESWPTPRNESTGDATRPDPAPASPESPATPPQPAAPSSANYGDIVINEVVPNPTEGKEWVELYNTTANTISLADWKISDGSSVIYEPDGQIAADGFFIAEVNNRLNNSGDAVYLSDASGKSIFQLIYGDWTSATVSAPEKGQSIARDDDGKFYITDTPTKNFKNLLSKSITTVTDFDNSSGTTTTAGLPTNFNFLSIIEILPNPESNDTENEYIKIHNAADYDVDMGGLYLDDGEGGSRPWKIPAGTVIKAGDGLTFLRSKTGLALNNDADVARILDKNKEELIAVEYEDALAGAIYIFKDRKWQWKNSASVIASGDEAISSSSVIPAKAGIQSKNSITATVIIPPGIFGSQIMYVDGLQLYMYSHDWPELQTGDKIYAFGTPSTYYSEPRLKLKDKNSIKIISRGNATEPVQADGLAEDDLARLIIIEGEVLQTANTKIILGANSEEISVYDKTKQKLFSRLKEKDQVQITGIVSQNKDEFRLLPRGAEDIKVTQTAEALLDKKAPIWQYAISTSAVGAIALGLYLRRRKNGNSNSKSAQPLG